METTEVLRKIKDICAEVDTCHDCDLRGISCDITPEYWTDKDIETMAEVINNYKETKT